MIQEMAELFGGVATVDPLSGILLAIGGVLLGVATVVVGALTLGAIGSVLRPV